MKTQTSINLTLPTHTQMTLITRHYCALWHFGCSSTPTSKEVVIIKDPETDHHPSSTKHASLVITHPSQRLTIQTNSNHPAHLITLWSKCWSDSEFSHKLCYHRFAPNTDLSIPMTLCCWPRWDDLGRVVLGQPPHVSISDNFFRPFAVSDDESLTRLGTHRWAHGTTKAVVLIPKDPVAPTCSRPRPAFCLADEYVSLSVEMMPESDVLPGGILTLPFLFRREPRPSFRVIDTPTMAQRAHCSTES